MISHFSPPSILTLCLHLPHAEFLSLAFSFLSPTFISLYKTSCIIIAESTPLDLNHHTVPMSGPDGSHREEGPFLS